MEGHESLDKWDGIVEDDVGDIKRLSEMFDAGFKMYNNLNKIDEPTNSTQVQATIKRTMHIFENCTRLVSLCDMFSSNESFEDVATENIKYFLLPALLGTLTTKICGTDNRMHLVDVSQIYFVDFLKRLKAYEIIDIQIPEIKHDEQKEETEIVHKKSEHEIITDSVKLRSTKIKRYQEQKDLEKKLDSLKQNLDNPNIDDETKREYFITLIKVFANQALEELDSLVSERTLLQHMSKMGHETQKKEVKHKSNAPKLQPIIITRDAVQKQVYGAGYPSLPVMTVQEFYDKRVQDGDWPEGSQRNQIGGKNLQDVASGKVDESLEAEREEEEKEDKIENDDPETLAKARAMDDYKDTHRRGWGNRANRS